MKIVNYLIICVVLPVGMIQLQRIIFPDGADDTYPIMRKMMNIPSSDAQPAPATDEQNMNNIDSSHSKYNHSIILPVIQDIFQASSEDGNQEKQDRNGKSFDQNDHVEIEIRKCCGKAELLDKWHQCSERRNISGIFNSEIQELLPEKARLNLNLKYNNFHCPRKMIQEFEPKEINFDGSIVIEMERSKTNTLDDYYCVDLTEIDDEFVDGFKLIQCDTQG